LFAKVLTHSFFVLIILPVSMGSGRFRLNDEQRRRIGTRIARLREERRWKQAGLAEVAGVEPSRLSKLERGALRLTVEDLVNVALALEISLDELVWGTPQESVLLMRHLQQITPAEDREKAARVLTAIAAGLRGAPREGPR